MVPNWCKQAGYRARRRIVQPQTNTDGLLARVQVSIICLLQRGLKLLLCDALLCSVFLCYEDVDVVVVWKMSLIGVGAFCEMLRSALYIDQLCTSKDGKILLCEYTVCCIW